MNLIDRDFDRMQVVRSSGSTEAAGQPLVSIVTPSFQAAPFIERTIESVLAQDYPRIEYIVIDGSSTDGTLEILERHRTRLRCVSAPRRGTADAVNLGFDQSQGSILGWLSADDVYLPGAVTAAVRHLEARRDVHVVYGEGIWIDEHGTRIGRYPTASPYDSRSFEKDCGICQPASFFRREAFESVGKLNPDLHFAFDYDLWVRLSRAWQFEAIPTVLAASRMHRQNKSLGSRRQVFEENISLLREHYGYVPLSWIYCYLTFLNDGRDQFFQPLRPSPRVYLESLPAGIRYNYRQLWRYLREWGGELTAERVWQAWRGRRSSREMD